MKYEKLTEKSDIRHAATTSRERHAAIFLLTAALWVSACMLQPDDCTKYPKYSVLNVIVLNVITPTQHMPVRRYAREWRSLSCKACHRWEVGWWADTYSLSLFECCIWILFVYYLNTDSTVCSDILPKPMCCSAYSGLPNDRRLPFLAGIILAWLLLPRL